MNDIRDVGQQLQLERADTRAAHEGVEQQALAKRACADRCKARITGLEDAERAFLAHIEDDIRDIAAHEGVDVRVLTGRTRANDRYKARISKLEEAERARSLVQGTELSRLQS